MANDPTTTKQRLLDYIHGKVQCINPNCEGHDISGESFDVDGNVVSQSVTCDGCGWSWYEDHELTGITEIEDVYGHSVDGAEIELIVRDPAL